MIVMKNTTKKTYKLGKRYSVILILGGGLLLIALLIMTGTFRQKTFPTLSFFYPAPTPQSVNSAPIIKTAVLTLKQISPTQMEVRIDTQNKPITGVQVELTYDARVLTQFTLTPGPFLPNPIILKNKSYSGTLFYAAVLSPSSVPVTGTGVIGLITFTVNPGITNQTPVHFTPRTAVVTEGIIDSVLKETRDSQISL